jgi:hypothetical protein
VKSAVLEGYPAEALLHWGERDRRHSGQTLWFRLTMCTRRRSRCSTLTPHNSMSRSRGTAGQLDEVPKDPRARKTWLATRPIAQRHTTGRDTTTRRSGALSARTRSILAVAVPIFFSYVNNNPIVGYDPFGLRTKCILAGAVGQRILVCWDDGNGNGDDSVQILGRPNGPPSIQSTNAAGIAADFDP